MGILSLLRENVFFSPNNIFFFERFLLYSILVLAKFMIFQFSLLKVFKCKSYMPIVFKKRYYLQMKTIVLLIWAFLEISVFL